ncbi:RnfABCDGE type electron transport complex subunit D [Selenihalanaerobacter shriftii]|uniref:Ion-translocating oxidoreductase complex subunit D n=1 Tax=Selenihalanaerobacter shriftii TaxID=142842 RepID=A0A1T4PU23_9FIRM|nr:RnfABCDGE type electron transport complex subunit D [Selenihalanaerobacter shriftii]SJZ95072.1 Na+-transporting NADH:ubiquinone oxidoreductase subunit B [Selenihalanaerobacter shriftii]
MNALRGLFDNLKRSESLKSVRPLIDAVDNIFFGPEEVTTSAPHIVDNNDLKRHMTMVILALLPSTLASIYFYGWRALAIILVSYAAGGITEVLFAIIRKHDIHEGFLVTGLIFPLVLPPTIPLWMVAVGSFFGVFFGKEVFGGTGRNVFNPAIAGRVFLSIAFPVAMSASWFKPLIGGLGGLLKYAPDAVASATPLAVIKAGGQLDVSVLQLLLGGTGGSMGETFRLGIILGGIFLIMTKIIDWRIPVAYLGSVLVFSVIGSQFLPAQVAPPVIQLLTGGLLFGAFFMATDPVTSPFTKSGMWIFGISAGILTLLFRVFGGYVEGVMFSILLMNGFTPLIDSVILDAKFKPKDNGVVYNEN